LSPHGHLSTVGVRLALKVLMNKCQQCGDTELGATQEGEKLEEKVEIIIRSFVGQP